MVNYLQMTDVERATEEVIELCDTLTSPERMSPREAIEFYEEIEQSAHTMIAALQEEYANPRTYLPGRCL